MQRGWILLHIMMIPSASADGGLKIKVSTTRPKFVATQDVSIIVQYNNTGNDTTYIHKWCLPDNELRDPLFRITCNGNPVDYVGPLIKRRAATVDDVTPLAPGESVGVVMRLSSAYDMSKNCSYSIQYNMPSDRVIFRSPVTSRIFTTVPINNAQSDVQSNTILLSIDGRPNVQPEQTNTMKRNRRSAVLSYISCSSARIFQISYAVSSALSYASSSYNYLNSLTSYSTQRYPTWFGTNTLTNWNTLKKHYQDITTVLNSKSIQFNCGCTDTNTFAFVYQNNPYVINLCGAFWSAPTTGTDSKGGTLVHEISHFTVVAGTQDYTYGQASCKSLAKTNPSRALQNADSHEYFAENNPALK